MEVPPNLPELEQDMAQEMCDTVTTALGKLDDERLNLMDAIEAMIEESLGHRVIKMNREYIKKQLKRCTAGFNRLCRENNLMPPTAKKKAKQSVEQYDPEAEPIDIPTLPKHLFNKATCIIPDDDDEIDSSTQPPSPPLDDNLPEQPQGGSEDIMEEGPAPTPPSSPSMAQNPPLLQHPPNNPDIPDSPPAPAASLSSHSNKSMELLTSVVSSSPKQGKLMAKHGTQGFTPGVRTILTSLTEHQGYAKSCANKAHKGLRWGHAHVGPRATYTS